ncbi:PH domain-containing protein [Kaistella jeonii]|uniref:Bacterial Pleckstrin homology domain-containing protein n=1 Tax=Kaistella jeonii TaxID=266749 RepID=A0A0C1D164_9FLAO|nr:PH domain-containing protein [Kaistella jeonii]KIA90466.1 hypothetical protein OA86_00780 [Kaistella jeonii]SFB72443.1 PH domain-containing protein [Kaistella jeonii]VEI94967.1 Uncharacterised protein [Kaistella jeonii]
MKEFQTAKMDGRTRTMTIILVLFLLLFPFISFFFEPRRTVISIFSLVIMYGVILISYGFVPKKITITESQILIKNLYGKIRINLNEIYSISKVKKTGFNLRTFGVGGLFGYFGYFNGKDIWYVTNIHKKIKITLKSGKVYMLSPENPDDFSNEIQTRKSSATS